MGEVAVRCNGDSTRKIRSECGVGHRPAPTPICNGGVIIINNDSLPSFGNNIKRDVGRDDSKVNGCPKHIGKGDIMGALF